MVFVRLILILRFLFSGELISILKLFESFIYTLYFILFLHRVWNTWNALLTINERNTATGMYFTAEFDYAVFLL